MGYRINIHHDLQRMRSIATGFGIYAEGRRRTVELDIAAWRADIIAQGDPVQMTRDDDSLLSQAHFTRLRFPEHFTPEQVQVSQDWYLNNPLYLNTLMAVVQAYGSSGAIDQVFALAAAAMRDDI